MKLANPLNINKYFTFTNSCVNGVLNKKGIILIANAE
jgi:hypothetical protein